MRSASINTAVGGSAAAPLDRPYLPRLPRLVLSRRTAVSCSSIHSYLPHCERAASRVIAFLALRSIKPARTKPLEVRATQETY